MEMVFSMWSVSRSYLQDNNTVQLRTPSSRQRGCYMRTITASVQLKKSLVMSLKGLDVKMNGLAVNRQS
jgi:hypothetical protein